MHLIARGIGKLLYDLITTANSNDKSFYFKRREGDQSLTSNGYPFYISKQQLTAIGTSICNSRKFIPTSFEGNFEDIISSCEGARAVDWLDFSLYIVPTTVVPCLPDNRCKKAVLSLVRGCSLALQWKLTEEDINALDRYIL